MTANDWLNTVAPAIKTGYELMGSKWQNCEAEVIAMQTITACHNNLTNHGDAFSWLLESATRGRAMCGTNNAAGLGRLLDDGSIVIEDYAGDLVPPSGVSRKDGKAQIIRVTEALLLYAASRLPPISPGATP